MTRIIDADALDSVMYHKAFEVYDGRTMWNSGCWIRYRIYEEASREAPTVDAVPVIRCKDCKYFELDHIEKVESIPLIVAHEICMRWGDGCKTSPDGYCFMAERKEE